MSKFSEMTYSRCFVPQGEWIAAYIREFPGCLTQGRTLAEAYDNLEKAADSWVEAALSQGQTIPPPLEHSWPKDVVHTVEEALAAAPNLSLCDTGENLRPVGTEYWYEFPPSQDGKQWKFLYQVVSHELAARNLGDKKGRLLERVKPIKSQTRRVTGMSGCPHCYGGWQYTFAEWEEEHAIS